MGWIARTLTVLAALAVIVPASAPAARAESLADVLVDAYENSNLLDQNRALLRAADEDVATAVAALRPVLNFVGEASYTGSQQGRTIDDLSGSLGLSADLLIYDFGRTQLGVDAAKESVLATRESLVDVEQQVLLGAVSAFMNVRSAIEFVEIARSNVRLLTEQLRAAEDRFSVGEVTRTDVALSEARLAAARSNLSASEGDLTAAREAFKLAVGRFPGTLQDTSPLPDLPETLADAKRIAQRNHPRIRQAQRQVTVAEINAARAAAATRGQVTAGARVAVDEQFDDTSSLSLQFSAPIYRGGELSALYRQALQRVESSRANLLQTARVIEDEVGRAWSEIEVGRARIVSSRQQIEAARIAFEGAREEATLGARTTLDVLDSEQELLNARGNLIAAENSQNISTYALLSAMGLLTVKDLNLGIPTYDPAGYYNAVKNAPATSVQGERLDRVLQAIGKSPD